MIPNIIEKIIVFFPKGELDSFLAAQAAKSFLPATAPIKYIGLEKGDKLPDLEGKYLFFFHIDFNMLAEVPDLRKAVNVVFIARHGELDAYLNMNILPQTVKRPIGKFSGKIVFDDKYPICKNAWEHFVETAERLNEIQPEFAKYAIDLLSNPSFGDNAAIITGIERDLAIMTDDVPDFQKRIMDVFPTKRDDMIKIFIQEGQNVRVNDADFVRNLIKSYAMETEFAGNHVMIACVPGEYAHQVGYQLAIDRPFAVVYEDRLAERKRTYHLYSTKAGMDVGEVAKPYTDANPDGAKSTSRYASFNVTMNFSNNRWV